MSGEFASMLEVLRRPPTDADHGARVEAVLSLLRTRGVSDINRDSARLLAERDEGVTVLVIRDGAAREDERAADSVVRQTACLVRASDRVVHREGEPHVDALGASMKCGVVGDLRAGRIAFTVPPAGLVPDGVLTVELTTSDGDVCVAPVRNNAYDMTISETAPDRWRLRWLDAEGREIS